MDGLSISAIWRFLTWLPRFLLKRIFTRERMADLILIDVRPRYDYASINLGDPPSFSVWLQAINLSPFDVEIDRIELRLFCGGVELKTSKLKRSRISSGSVLSVLLNDNIGDGHARQIKRNLDNHQTAIELDVEFNCSLHDFSKSTGRLEGLKPRFVNADYVLVSEGNPN